MIRPRAAQKKHRFGKKEDYFFFFFTGFKGSRRGKTKGAVPSEERKLAQYSVCNQRESLSQENTSKHSWTCCL